MSNPLFSRVVLAGRWWPAPGRCRWLLLLLAPAALIGCDTTPVQPPSEPAVVLTAPKPPEPDPSEKEPEEALATAPDATAAARPSLLRLALQYADRAAGLTPPELTAEIARLTPLQDESVQRQLELALALGQTRQPVDTARALGLVQRVLGQKDNPPTFQSFARLLETRYLQQRRLEDQLDRLTQQMRDAQRRNDQLNDRLEAMRAIERSLNARPPGSPAANGKAPSASAP